MTHGFALLRKQHLAPPADIRVVSSLPADLDQYGGLTAFDLETHGLDPRKGAIRSIALSNDYGTIAIDYEALPDSQQRDLMQWMLQQQVIAHNAMFDCAWIYHITGCLPQIEACTLILFKMMATEGYTGQRWGLKTAMTDVLGWPESNEKDLYDWLKANKLRAADMAQAPWDILGKYNALDTAATWQLYSYFRQVCEENNWQECILDFHKSDFINLVNLLIEQQQKGITVDLVAMEIFDKKLQDSIEEHKDAILMDEAVRPHVEYYQQLIVESILEARPDQFTKTGKVAARYTKWEEKLHGAENRLDFNINSGNQLKWLFFERMMFECPILTDTGTQSITKKTLKYLGKYGKMIKDYREVVKRREFVASLYDVQQDGVVHPNMKPHATVSGRCGGGQTK